MYTPTNFDTTFQNLAYYLGYFGAQILQVTTFLNFILTHFL